MTRLKKPDVRSLFIVGAHAGVARIHTGAVRLDRKVQRRRIDETRIGPEIVRPVSVGRRGGDDRGFGGDAVVVGQVVARVVVHTEGLSRPPKDVVLDYGVAARIAEEEEPAFV